MRDVETRSDLETVLAAFYKKAFSDSRKRLFCNYQNINDVFFAIGLLTYIFV